MKTILKVILFAFSFLVFVSSSCFVYAFDSRGPNIAGVSFGESEHEKITEEALKDLGFLHKKIEEIEDANTNVDWKEHSIRWWFIFPVGLKTNEHYNPEHHFDRGPKKTSQEAFKEGVKYVHQQKEDFKQHFRQCDTEKALKALGKALHALQDFFAHSNYVDDPPSDKENSKKKWLSEEERKQALEALLDPTKDPPANLELTGYYPDEKKPGNAANDPYPHDANAKDDKGSKHGKAKFQEAKKAAIDATKKFVENIMKELEAELKEKQKEIWSKKTMELFGEEKIFVSVPKSESVISEPKSENKKPIIKGLTVNQLHFSYSEVPHRYRLIVDASDPDANLPLTYAWSINCGYFFGATNSQAVEWRYNTPGECIYAKATVTVTDSLGLSDQLVDFSLF